MKDLSGALIVVAIIAGAVTLVLTDHTGWLIGLPLLALAIL